MISGAYLLEHRQSSSKIKNWRTTGGYRLTVYLTQTRLSRNHSRASNFRELADLDLNRTGGQAMALMRCAMDDLSGGPRHFPIAFAISG